MSGDLDEMILEAYKGSFEAMINVSDSWRLMYESAQDLAEYWKQKAKFYETMIKGEEA